MCPSLSLSAARQDDSPPPGQPEAESDVSPLPPDWPLCHGGTLRHGRLAWEITGPPSAPVVAVLGGISAHRHVTATAADPQPGWWQEMVGAGCAIDTDAFRVLAFDFLGGNGRSSGPRGDGGEVLAPIDSRDQARALRHLLDRLGIASLHGFVGASYGGMVGLSFAVEAPGRLGRLLTIGAAYRSHPQSTALRTLQRRAVRWGIELGQAEEGLALARGLAMVTYRSRDELVSRFSGPPERTGERFRFPVERYLEARGADFGARFHPNAFLTLSESIDLHAVEPTQLATPTTLVAVPSDQLVPIEDVRSLAGSAAGPCRVVELESLYGHDAFLKEPDRLGAIVAETLAGVPA